MAQLKAISSCSPTSLAFQVKKRESLLFNDRVSCPRKLSSASEGVGELEGLEAKAKASGASQLVVKDLKEEFVRDFIFPCLRAGAIYERKYLLGTSMARPVIAKQANERFEHETNKERRDV
ncbi:hypothetical protein SO802_020161 [Lithocarpus litseifolius]|uniref:Arginosuccinate synthase-like N-terminal domain-containing protein n=1 Tax=Lithocarpus litseifolius TaxID=425828 RepID=A0AAW2CGI0_9ROSI